MEDGTEQNSATPDPGKRQNQPEANRSSRRDLPRSLFSLIKKPADQSMD
ncbi:hypothetical protein IFO70_04170 [Phormidium tenue FACHB-886]|nr:hypothetical protein [Phormidium tenue FACHB-886]